MALASVPLQEARVLLNNASGNMFTDAILLPYLQKAYRELLLKMDTRQSDIIDEISANISVLAGAVIITAPADLIRPTKIEEKSVGASDNDFVEMTEMEWEQTYIQQSFLNLWAWREEEIKTPGSTTDRVVRIFYLKSLTAPIDATSALGISRSETFLATRTAALAARYVQQDNMRADALDADTMLALKDYMTSEVRSKQGKPARRRPYGTRWRYNNTRR